MKSIRYKLTAKVGVFFPGPTIPIGEYRWEWAARLRAWLYLQLYPLREVELEIILPTRFRVTLEKIPGASHTQFGVLHDVEQFLIGYVSPVQPEDSTTFEKARELLERVKEAQRHKI